MNLSVLSVAYPLAAVGPQAAGGAEQILAQLDAGLVARGHRSVVIACEGSETRGTLLATPRYLGPFDDAVRARSRRSHAEAIAQALGRWTFDLVHMHALDFHAYLPPPGVPVLATLHLPPEWYAPEIFAPARANFWLHCVSAAQEPACPQGAALLPYIANGVPVEQFPARRKKRDFAVALGRICPEKGFHLAVDAAAQAGLPLFLAGEVFPYREHERYFQEEVLPRLNGRTLRFLGAVAGARKRRLLAAARCLLVPSLAPETSSLVAMEALASGTPVIAFRSGALPEIVEHGRTGFIVDGVREMACAIRMVERIDPEECRKAARERFSAARMIAQYLELYQSLAQSLAPWGMEAGGYSAA